MGAVGTSALASASSMQGGWGEDMAVFIGKIFFVFFLILLYGRIKYG